ncbi:glycosyltransferase family 4 protein [Rubrivivax sp. RP6-9]|uniref:glycosyltransferase family 4 protein n=1 Tax=Rubrivivax sp. RP6-9 TaxID=3415750 RepID=UPI003CC59D6A
MAGDVRILLFSSLYPSSARPLHGIFVETRLRELLRNGGVQARVVAPVPWFWSTDLRHGRYADLARTPRREVHNGIEVSHPRYPTLPKIGMTLAPFFMALGARAALREVQREGFDFDLIDAHYYYPDGVAAAILAWWFAKPLVVTARGTDVNLIPNHRLPRLLIQWAARRAGASIGVSAALVERMRELHMDADRLHVMRNGVDAQRFRPLPMAQARATLGLAGDPVLLGVGNLYEHKGQRLVVEAFARLAQRRPQATLLLVGDGPDRELLRQSAVRLGLGDRVRLVGTVPNTDLAAWYSAADVMVLGSSREGWPNVLLEAMACGTPVVASAVGGIPEVVASAEVGRVVAERTAAAFEAAIEELLEARPDRTQVRRYAEGFGWDRTSQQQLQLFNTLVAAA